MTQCSDRRGDLVFAVSYRRPRRATLGVCGRTVTG